MSRGEVCRGLPRTQQEPNEPWRSFPKITEDSTRIEWAVAKFAEDYQGLNKNRMSRGEVSRRLPRTQQESNEPWRSLPRITKDSTRTEWAVAKFAEDYQGLNKNRMSRGKVSRRLPRTQQEPNEPWRSFPKITKDSTRTEWAVAKFPEDYQGLNKNRMSRGEVCRGLPRTQQEPNEPWQSLPRITKDSTRTEWAVAKFPEDYRGLNKNRMSRGKVCRGLPKILMSELLTLRVYHRGLERAWCAKFLYNKQNVGCRRYALLFY